MSDFSSLTHKFRANLDSQQVGANKVSKRNRQPLSCAPCRIKKLKCDRGHPCETCTKRGDQANCTYGKIVPSVALASRPEPNSSAGPGGANSRARAQERLRHLEQLVMQIVDNPMNPSTQRSDGMASASSLENNDTSTTTSLAKEGHLQYGSSESRYVGSTHWSAILENIQELKAALGNEQGLPTTSELDESEDVEAPEADGLFGSTGNLSLAQVLSQTLPTRLQVDRRLSTYFNSRYLVVPFIHTAHFQRQYEQFWRTPLETPPLWVSILFSICCMSATLSEAVGSEPSTPEDQLSPRMGFLAGACQCLRLGGFLRPKRYVVEALGLYAQCKYMSTLDPSREVGVIFTMVIRLAYRSGYHRDPSQFPHFSVFDGEMRRRTWAMCRQFDLMISFQLGLPQQIPSYSWDTMPPSNLLDADFDEHTITLPPSRPEAEATQILYFIVKSRLMDSFGKVCSHAVSFRESSQQEVMDLDAEVRAVHATVPDILRIRPMSQSFTDPSYLIMVRLNCEFLHQKSLCVLHRKYMTQGNYPASTQACTDAATAIAKHMLDLHKEFKPGGQLFSDRWMLSSFTMNDFYLASMVLCLGLSMWKRANPGKDISEDEKMESQYTLLRSAFAICEELSSTSTEAKRVAGVLRVVFDEMGSLTPKPGSKGSNGGGPMSESPIQPTWSSKPHPLLLQPARFGGSAFFPTPYDFNLAPLSLQDRGEVSNSLPPSFPPSSTEQAYTQPQSQQSEYFNYLTSIPHSLQTPASSPGGRGGGQFLHPPNLGPNPFTSFLPFSLSYPPNPASQAVQSSNTDASNPIDANPSMTTPLSLDVDWAFLDQWMALPNPDIVPLDENSLPFNTSMPPAHPQSP